MKYAYLFLAIISFVSTLSAQSAADVSNAPSASLQEFVRPRSTGTALTPYNGVYVKTAKDLTEEFNLTYDYPGFTAAVASDLSGDTISLTARYNRKTASVEIILGEELRELDGAQIPIVNIGVNTYLYIQKGDKNGVTGSFAKLVAQAPDGKYAATQLYTIKQASNVPPQRGISSQKPKTISLDSSAYLLGLRPLAVELPRRKALLVKDLSKCERSAFESLKQYKPRKASYLQELCAALSAACAEQEGVPVEK